MKRWLPSSRSLNASTALIVGAWTAAITTPPATTDNATIASSTSLLTVTFGFRITRTPPLCSSILGAAAAMSGLTPHHDSPDLMRHNITLAKHYDESEPKNFIRASCCYFCDHRFRMRQRP